MLQHPPSELGPRGLIAPGSADPAVHARAFAENRRLITFDKDFGELGFKRGAKASQGIVLPRIPQTSMRQRCPALQSGAEATAVQTLARRSSILKLAKRLDCGAVTAAFGVSRTNTISKSWQWV